MPGQKFMLRGKEMNAGKLPGRKIRKKTEQTPRVNAICQIWRAGPEVAKPLNPLVQMIPYRKQTGTVGPWGQPLGNQPIKRQRPTRWLLGTWMERLDYEDPSDLSKTD